jgi:hypothetical protein
VSRLVGDDPNRGYVSFSDVGCGVPDLQGLDHRGQCGGAGSLLEAVDVLVVAANGLWIMAGYFLNFLALGFSEKW